MENKELGAVGMEWMGRKPVCCTYSFMRFLMFFDIVVMYKLF